MGREEALRDLGDPKRWDYSKYIKTSIVANNQNCQVKLIKWVGA